MNKLKKPKNKKLVFENTKKIVKILEEIF